jgi:hypothetical protein
VIEINTFNARASISALSQANQVATPKTISPSRAQADKSATTLATPSFRQVSRTEAAAFSVDLTAVGDGRKDTSDALAGTFEDLLEIFNGKGRAQEALESALSSVSDLIDTAAGDTDVVGVQLRVVSVVRSFGTENGDDAAYGSVTGFAIEVGLVRDGNVSAEDVQLVGLSGEPIDLSGEQRRTGVVDGLYQVQDKAPFADELATLRGENKAQVEALKNALDRLRLVQDALGAYRKGDTRALEEVEKFFRSGTLDAGAVRAISDVRGNNQTVFFPGSGVVSFN